MTLMLAVDALLAGWGGVNE